MKVTLSMLRRLEKKDRLMLQFNVTFRWEDETGQFTETHKRAIAGFDKDGKPWIRPPSPNPIFPTTFWSDSLKLAIIGILQRHKLLDGLESPWKRIEEDETTYE